MRPVGFLKKLRAIEQQEDGELAVVVTVMK